MSEGDNLTPHNDRMLRMARAAVPRGRYDLSPKQIIMARHMANDGAELGDVMIALGWKCARGNGRKTLGKRYGIWPHVLTKQSRRGEPTSLSNHSTSFEVYRPKQARS